MYVSFSRFLPDQGPVYVAAEGDPVSQNAYKIQYDATLLEMNYTIVDARHTNVSGITIQVYQTATPLATVAVNPGGGTITVQATAVADNSAIGDISDAGQNVLAELYKAENYSAQMKSMSSMLQTQMKFTDTIINSNNATISVIIDIDEVAAMAELTVLQIRQQATVAMMAQANTIAGYAALMFTGKQ